MADVIIIIFLLSETIIIVIGLMYRIPLAAFLFLDPKRDEESEESGDLMK